MPACPVVRAVVADSADRPAFDRRYCTEHLPDAPKAFKAQSAMRGWSMIDPTVHTAHYRSDTARDTQPAGAGPEIKTLIAAFDRVWDTGVVRARDIPAIAEQLKG